MQNFTSTGQIQKSIATGNWKPNMYLTNLSTAYFQLESDYIANKLFPIVPVQTSTGHFYKFDKATLARDDMQRKPTYGKVQPVIFGNDEDTYSCVVDQGIIGIDQISTLNYQRSITPGINDPRKAKVRVLIEKTKIHQDVIFGQNYFQPGVWANEYTGASANPSGKQFYKFTNDNSDPINLFKQLRRELHREGRRKPNKLALGVKTYDALTENPIIMERVRYGGTTANPATINSNVLAQLFEVDEVVVFQSTYNTAPLGQPPQMEYICDETGALLLYAPSSPSIDEPSAGYIFTWDMLGDGNMMPIAQWQGENGTHSEFIEALMAYDMKKTGDDLAIYLSDCV